MNQHPEKSKKETQEVDVNEYFFPKFEESDIKEAFDCFDINSNGYISVDELRTIFQELNEDVSDEELDEMIKLADSEGDGQVNWIAFYQFVTGNVSLNFFK
jgi:Ca2+-binding EF-hand superfamily protein